MDGQSAAVEIIRLVAEKVEQLTIHKGCDEIEGAVRIADDNEQGRFAVTQGIQLQLVGLHQIPQLLDIEGSETGTAAN